MPDKVLITGGHGFIGTHLGRVLLSNGYKVVSYGRSNNSAPRFRNEKESSPAHQRVFAELGNSGQLADALANCTTIFHKAASCPSASIQNDESLFQANLVGTKALISTLSANKTNLEHLILDSSISVYGEGAYTCFTCGTVRPDLRDLKSVQRTSSFEPQCPKCSSQIQPTDTFETAALNGHSHYARSKAEQEFLLEEASKQLGFKLSIMRYATVYGANQSERSTYGRLLRSITNGDGVYVNEDGNQKRDFIYIDDVIDANLRVMSRTGTKNATFNIGSGKETPLIDFITTAIELTPANSRRSAVEIKNTMSEGDIRHCKISCEKASTELGFVAKVPLEQGLAKTLKEYSLSK